MRRPWVLDEAAAFFGHAPCGSEDRLRRAGSEAYQNRGANHRHFRFEPRLAGSQLSAVRLLVNSPLAAFFEFEMLHGVGDIDGKAIDTGFDQRAIEEAAGGSDKWMALAVFLITGLFTNEHDGSRTLAFAEDSLSGMFVQIASVAGLHGLLQRGKGDFGRQKIGGG